MALNPTKPIDILPGVEPLEDSTALSTEHYTAASGIRFWKGKPRKVGGFDSLSFDKAMTIDGCVRTVYSQFIAGKLWYLIGTDTRLYALTGSQLTNITPLTTNTTAIADSLDSNYTTLGNNPISTTDGSATVTIAHTGHRLFAGDSITISGVDAPVGGISDSDLNATHVVRSIQPNSYTIILDSAATSTDTGGGNAVIEATAICTVNHTSHGQADGDRVKITAATDFGGLQATEINAEHIIRNVSANEYDIVLTTKATSAVSGGGGSGTEVQYQIAAGDCDARAGQGYGMGRYGVGRYGVSKTSQNITYPRIWSFGQFGQNIVMTPGGQTSLYSWDGDVSEAPAIVQNAPAAIDYVFVFGDIIFVLNPGGVFGRLQCNNRGELTTWSPTAQNTARTRDVFGADRFLTHAATDNEVMLFTRAGQGFTLRELNNSSPFVFATKRKESVKDGPVGQNAVVAVHNTVYWEGKNNWYMCPEGGTAQPMPSNSKPYSTVLRHVFDNRNTVQAVKSFAWFNEAFQEIWFHSVSALSDEPDKVVRTNIYERHWTPDSLIRTAAEKPQTLGEYPRLIGDDGTMYRHEKGVDADGSPLAFSLTSNLRQAGSGQTKLGDIILDNTQTGDITVTVTTKPYPQGSANPSTSYTVTPTTKKISGVAAGLTWQYQVSQSVLGGFWEAGVWQQEVQQWSPK